MIIELKNKERITLSGPGRVHEIMRDVLLQENEIDQEKEHFWVIGLDNKSSIKYIELVSLGSGRHTIVEPMNVFRMAVLKGVSFLILIHNHPSDGEIKISSEDKLITKKLVMGGQILNIQVLDHIVINQYYFESFTDSGLMDTLSDR